MAWDWDGNRNFNKEILAWTPNVAVGEEEDVADAPELLCATPVARQQDAANSSPSTGATIGTALAEAPPKSRTKSLTASQRVASEAGAKRARGDLLEELKARLPVAYHHQGDEVRLYLHGITSADKVRLLVNTEKHTIEVLAKRKLAPEMRLDSLKVW